MTTVRVGASMAKNAQEVLDWLHINVGDFVSRESVMKGIDYKGKNWSANWRQFGSGWFMYVTFNDPKHATFFTLRWK